MRVHFVNIMGLFIVLWCQACDSVSNELLEIVGVEEMQKFSLYTDVYDLPKDGRNSFDESKYLSLTLDNGLEVLLISNAKYSKSAAAMDIGVGSLADPEKFPGLAHFLEHMLFLGTKKYPKVGEYNEYLTAHQGAFNAYTGRENTNYFFEINHDAFEGALDRFSRFFIEPLFDINYVEREINAVNSEHQKNLNSDVWRKMRILSLLARESHPKRKFSTGDKNTLKNVDKKVLLDFHSKYYSANQMKLVLLSSSSIEQMKEWTSKMFAGILNTNKEENIYSSNVYEKNNLQKLVRIKPVKDLRSLELIFPAPSNSEDWLSKPTHIITSIIGHEGRGSLLSELKARKFATGLSAWFEESTYAGEFHVKIDLSEEGMEQYKKVVQLFYVYLEMLKKSGYPEYIYREMKVMAEIEYVHREHMEGSDFASYLASKMHLYPALEVERRSFLIYKEDKQKFEKFLSFINSKNSNIILSDINFSPSNKEKYYGASYEIENIATSIDDFIKPFDKHSMHMPLKNNFIPDNMSVAKVTKKSDYPDKVVNDKRGFIWYQKDSEFLKPRAKVSFVLMSPAAAQTPLNKVKAILYHKALGEKLNEWKYEVLLAGLDFSISHSPRGVSLSFEGFSQHLPKLIREVADKLKDITIDEDLFKLLKKEFKRDISNHQYDKAYQQTLYEMQNLLSPLVTHYKEYYDPELKKDLISPLSLQDVQDFANEKLYTSTSIEGLAYGNLNKEDIKTSIEYFLRVVGSSYYLPVKERIYNTVYKLEAGEKIAYRRPSTKGSPNYCWSMYVQHGKRDFKLNAAVRIFQSILESDFYTTLRTQQQLGYIVHSGLKFDNKSLGTLFLIQSSDYNPAVIQERFNKWSKQALVKLSDFPQEKFLAIKESIITSLLEEDKTILEKFDTLWFEAVAMKGIFDYKQLVVAELEKITKKDVVEIYRKSFSDKSISSLTVVLPKDNKDSFSLDKEFKFISNTSEYKKAAVSY
jgi:insulysin